MKLLSSIALLSLVLTSCGTAGYRQNTDTEVRVLAGFGVQETKLSDQGESIADRAARVHTTVEVNQELEGLEGFTAGARFGVGSTNALLDDGFAIADADILDFSLEGVFRQTFGGKDKALRPFIDVGFGYNFNDVSVEIARIQQNVNANGFLVNTAVGLEYYLGNGVTLIAGVGAGYTMGTLGTFDTDFDAIRVHGTFGGKMDF